MLRLDWGAGAQAERDIATDVYNCPFAPLSSLRWIFFQDTLALAASFSIWVVPNVVLPHQRFYMITMLSSITKAHVWCLHPVCTSEPKPGLGSEFRIELP
jgi:hypothetical protein